MRNGMLLPSDSAMSRAFALYKTVSERDSSDIPIEILRGRIVATALLLEAMLLVRRLAVLSQSIVRCIDKGGKDDMNFIAGQVKVLVEQSARSSRGNAYRLASGTKQSLVSGRDLKNWRIAS